MIKFEIHCYQCRIESAMRSYTLSTLLIIIAALAHASGESTCQSDKCYRNVNTTHASLTELLGRFHDTLLTAKFPTFPDYVRIHNITTSWRKIWNESDQKLSELRNATPIVEECYDTYIVNKNNLSHARDRLRDIKEKYYGNVTVLNGILHDFKDLFVSTVKVLDGNMKASEECRNMEAERLQLQEFVEATVKELEALKGMFEELRKRIEASNGDMKKIYGSTAGDMSSFDSLKIPDGVIATYLREMDVKFGSLLEKLRENVAIIDSLLQAMFTGQSDTLGDQIKKVRQLVDDLQAILESFAADLRAYDEAVLKVDFTPIIHDDNRKLIEDLQNELKKLEEKHKSYVENFGNYRKILDDIKTRIPIHRKTIEGIDEETAKLKEYNMILKLALLSKTRIRAIKTEIDKSKRTLRVIQIKKDLEEELQGLTNIYDELMRTEKKCPTNVEFET